MLLSHAALHEDHVVPSLAPEMPSRPYTRTSASEGKTMYYDGDVLVAWKQDGMPLVEPDDKGMWPTVNGRIVSPASRLV